MMTIRELIVLVIVLATMAAIGMGVLTGLQALGLLILAAVASYLVWRR